MLGCRGGPGTGPGVAERCSQRVADALRRSGEFSTVVPAADVMAQAWPEARDALAACEDAACATEVSGALGVPLVAVVRLSMDKGAVAAVLEIAETSSGKVRGVATGRFAGTGDEELDAAAEALLGRALPAVTGHSAAFASAPGREGAGVGALVLRGLGAAGLAGGVLGLLFSLGAVAGTVAVAVAPYFVLVPLPVTAPRERDFMFIVAIVVSAVVTGVAWLVTAALVAGGGAALAGSFLL